MAAVLLSQSVPALLLAVLLWGGVRLGLRLKRQRFGSRLLVKLAGIFAIVGVVPGLVIYTVSYQFVTRSIESWFDVKVEGALAGLLASPGPALLHVKIDARANVWPLVPPNTANSQMLESNPNEKKAESAHALPA